MPVIGNSRTSKKTDGTPSLKRRGFIVGAAASLCPGVAGAALTDLMCQPAVQSPAIVRTPSREILERAQDYSSGRVAPVRDGAGGRWVSLRSNKRDETYQRRYYANGNYIQDALDEWNWFCRDGWGNVGPMDPGTLDILWEIGQRIGLTEPFTLTSGFRSQKYNAKLGGAAKKSLHIEGKALDISHPQVSIKKLHSVAVISQAGGIGRYSSWIHVDTGRRRFWTG